MKAKNVRTFELKLGKRALIVFILGMSSLLFVVFLLGIRVGKMMDAYPEKAAQGFPYLVMDCFGWSPKKIVPEAAVNEPSKEPAGTGEETADLTFYDTLNQKKKSAKIEERAPGSSSAAVGEKPSQKMNEAVGKTAVKPFTIKGKYHIQVVSLKEKEKADQICKHLIKLGYSPQIVTADLPDRGKWFRVILDGFESRMQAQKTTDIVSKKINGVNCVIRES